MMKIHVTEVWLHYSSSSNGAKVLRSSERLGQLSTQEVIHVLTILPDFHDGPVASLAKQDKFVLSERDPPDRFAGLSEIPDQFASGSVPELDAAIIATSDHEAVIKLV